MDKSISILDKDYRLWIQDLCKRYQQIVHNLWTISAEEMPQAMAQSQTSEFVPQLEEQIQSGISEYDLEKLYPEKVEGTIPTIEEIETKLGVTNDDKQ